MSSSSTDVAWYVPNLLSYGRVLAMILMVYQISKKKQPYLTFAYCLLSGVLDSIDGDAARYYKQGSRFGLLIDVAVDKLNNLAQYYALTSMYPSYAISLLWITFIEMTEVITTIAYKEYKFKYQLAKVLAAGNTSIGSFKQEFLTEMGIKKASADSKEIEFNQPYTIDLWLYCVHLTWYFSDMFFWLLYFNYFAKDYNLSFNGTSGGSGASKKTTGIENLFENLAAFFEYHFKKRLSIVNLDFKIIFKLLSVACFVGAVLKTFLNFQVMMSNYLGVMEIDNKLNILIPSLVS